MSDFNLYGLLAGNHIIASSGVSAVIGTIGSFTTITGSGTVTATNGSFGGLSLSNALSYAQDVYNSSIIPSAPTSSAANIGNTVFTPGNMTFTNAGGVTLGGAPPLNQITLDGAGFYSFYVLSGDLISDPILAPVSFIYLNGACPSRVQWSVAGSVNFQSIGGNITTWGGVVVATTDITLGSNCFSAGTLAALSGIITVNDNYINSQTAQAALDAISADYITLQTTLPDNKAIQIDAMNTYGGIWVNAGLGGIAMQTTNSINMTSTTASALTVTGAGNLVLQAQQGILALDGKTAVNIGRDVTYTAPVINIGLNTSTNALNLYAGSGGINGNCSTGGPVSLNANGANSNLTLVSTADNQRLTMALTGAHASGIAIASSGTGDAGDSVPAITVNASAGGIAITAAKDYLIEGGLVTPTATSIHLNSGGGITATSATKTLVSAADTSVTAIQLTSAFTEGGVSVNAGAAGITLDSYNSTAQTGAVRVYSGSGGITLDASLASSGSVYVTSGTGGIILQNSYAIAITSGSWGLSINTSGGALIGIGQNASGEIQLGTYSAADRTVTIGNKANGATLIQRWGAGTNGALLQTQPAAVDLGTGTTATPTTNQLLARILYATPTAAMTVTLPTASTIVTALSALGGTPGLMVGDSFDFTLINQSTVVNSATITMAAGTAGTIVGNADIVATSDNTNSFYASGSGSFRLRIDNVGTPAYTMYRVS